MKNKYYLIILIILAVLTHLPWFNPTTILFNSDWTHWTDIATTELLQGGWGSWLYHSGVGAVNKQYNFIFFKWIWGVIGNYEIATKLTFFIPIALLGFLAPYWFIRDITKNNFLSFVGALLYASNTYFIVRQTAHLPIAFVFALTPLILLFYKRYISQSFSRYHLFSFGIIFSIGLGYEARIMYIVSFILFLYTLIVHFDFLRKKAFWGKMLGFVLLILILNVYWIIPTALSSTEAILATANRGLFGDFLFSLSYALTGFDSSWKRGLPDQNFQTQIIPSLFWIYPLIILFGLLYRTYRSSNKKYIYFGLVVYLLGVLLTKQSSLPFPNVYLWLYDNFPGFSLFREASKLYLLTGLGFLVLVPLILNELPKKIKILFSATSIILSAYIFVPLISGSMGTLWENKIEPSDYKILNPYISQQKDSFKMLWIPANTQRSYYSIKHPRIGLVNEFDKVFEGDKIVPVSQRDFNDYASFMIKVISQTKLNQLGIKYVLLPLDVQQDDVLKYYISSGKQYLEQLNNIDFLKRIYIDGVKNIALYENKLYSSVISSTGGNISWKQINPNKYTISMNLSGDHSNLIFLQSFSKDRKLYPSTQGTQCSSNLQKQHDSYVFGTSTINTISANIIECMSDSYSFVNRGDISYLLQQEVFDEDHYKVYQYANIRNINREYIIKHFPQESYKINQDGSLDVYMSIYFRPQSWFYVGIIMSGSAFVVSTLYLIFAYLLKPKRK